MRAGLQDERARGQVIREAVVHDIAGANARREQRARGVEIVAVPFGLEDRPGRHEQPLRLAGRRDVEAAERRRLFCRPSSVGLAQQRQLRERRAAGHGLRIDAGEMLRPAGRGHRVRDLRGQPREQVPLARGGIAGFEGVEVVETC